MHLARFSPLIGAAVLCAAASTAQAQFSAQFNSGRWMPATGSQHANSGYGYSDGTSEDALGLTAGGELAWFQGFDTNAAGAASDNIFLVATVNGSFGTTNGAPAGNVGAAYVYDDPGGDFINPTDLTGADIMGSGSWTTCCPNTDTFEPITIAPAAAVTDGFWAASVMPQVAGEFPAAMDLNTPSLSRTWVAGSSTTFDPTNPTGGIGMFEMSALGFDTVWLTEASGSGTGDLIITEVVDGTLPGGQPKFVELTNVGDPIPDLSIYSFGNFNNGGTNLGGGAATQLNAVPLGSGDSYIFAYESSTNTGCDPNDILTCFEFVYGFAPDQYAGGGFVNGDDVLALFLGQATGDGSDAIMVDVYGVLGVDGSGQFWETTDGYSQRCDTTNLGYFENCQWFIAGANSLEDPGGDDAVELMLLQTLTDPGQLTNCTTNCPDFYCTAKTNSCGTIPAIGRVGTPSATASSGFVVTLVNAKAAGGAGGNPKAGVLLYSVSGPSSSPFEGGLLCVDGPRRTVVRAPSGPGTSGFCDASHSVDMNAYAQDAISGQTAPDPALQIVGTEVWTQWFARDTIVNGPVLSDGMHYVVRP